MLAVSIRKESMRTRAKLFTVLLLVATGGAVVLSCYALFIQTQAEALLKDLTALTVGTSTEFDAEQLARKHSRYLVSRESSDGIAITTFNVQNKWLSAVKLEAHLHYSVHLLVCEADMCTALARVLALDKVSHPNLPRRRNGR